MKKKKSGYFWRFRKMLIKKRIVSVSWIGNENGLATFDVTKESLLRLNPRQRKYLIRNWFDFRGFFFVWLFFACSVFAFQGAGDCEKLLADFAQLTNKSVFLPRTLSGSCVIQSEKHFPMILKSAGFDYRLKDDVIQVSAIEKNFVQRDKPQWKPKSLFYDVVFVFVNSSTAYDCGLKMRDIVATAENLDYAFTLGLSLGCPALDADGSFSFRVNVHLLDSWSYSHGTESARQQAQITSSTGAVTNQYEYITTGLNLVLEQNENGVFYTLKYTGNNGSVTTSHGGIIDEIRATITDEYEGVKKFVFLPIGKERKHAMYNLVLRIVPRNNT